MEKNYHTTTNQRKLERFLLLIYSVYNVAIFFISINKDWDLWISFLVFMNIVICWAVYVGEYGDYEFRAVFTATMMQLSIALYTTHLTSLFPAASMLIAFIVFSGLYGIAGIIYLTMCTATFVFVYHGFFTDVIQFYSIERAVRMLLQMGNVYFVAGVVCFWVKKRNESSRNLLEVIQVLEEAQRSKDDFLANVSHEIRTPINTICGMSEVVLREEEPKKIREEVLKIQTAGRNLMSVVSDILDFSELQSGKMELEEEAYNITSTINDVINMTLAQKSEKNIELIVDCDANIPSGLLGDEKKIRRVIMNLVDNAIKFTNDGFVSIIITFRREDYGINLIVTVKDTGIGMDAESLEKLFTSFNQVDTKRSRQEGGIGLGLAISQVLVQKMGGVISVKSKPGKGTILQFVVPQKILNEQPIVQIENKENCRLATYINMEQFNMVAVRDEYANNIRHMVEQTQISCRVCRNLEELKRRIEYETFTHVFISDVEYREDQKYFDQLALQTRLISIIDPQDETYMVNPNIQLIYKPFFVLPIASVLNEEKTVRPEKFIAPDAKILVVDDNEMNIDVIEGLLKNYQIQVSKAESGVEALKKIETMDYDFVFMDHMMPGMDGVETLHRIREKVGSYYQNVPVIALTANAVAGTREMFLAQGFCDFLEKPIEVSVLERVLKRNLPKEKILPAVSKEQEVPDQVQEDEGLCIPGVDAAKGIYYCGGEEKYLNILQRFSQNGEENKERVQEFYEKQDWKNYTILVHGIKGSMISLGAVALSELARQLELAGKEGNIDYIRKHHDRMMEEYQTLITVLQKNERVNPPEKETENSMDLRILDDTAFDQFIQRLEDAVFMVDGDAMMDILSEMQNCRYCGMNLREPMIAVKKKVEMSDYMSAGEAVIRLRERLRKGAEGDDASC